MHRRLYSILLIPLLMALAGVGGGGEPATSIPASRVIELEMPAERRVPPTAKPTVAPKPVEIPKMAPRPKLEGEYSALEGKILDAKTKKPIVGAEVSIPELDRRTVTDNGGRFYLGNIKARNQSYEVLVTCPGYVSFFADAVFEAGKRLNCEYRLKPVGW